MKTWLIWFAAISLSGCATRAPVSPCVGFTPPPPIPERLTIRVTPEHIEADRGGEQLLRSYALWREQYRAVCASPR